MREGSALPDLLGLRVPGAHLSHNLARWLPRLDAETVFARAAAVQAAGRQLTAARVADLLPLPLRTVERLRGVDVPKSWVRAVRGWARIRCRGRG